MTDVPIHQPMKAYVATPQGQIHYRHMMGGEGAHDLVLLHWTPGCSRQYEAFIPAFARRGYNVYAPDLMGLGRSDQRRGEWNIEDFADNLAHALQALGLHRVLLVAGHMGAAVGSELILRWPGLVDKVALDGAPAWTDEEREALLKRVSIPKPAIKDDGSHKALPWERAVFTLKEWNRDFEVTSDTLMDVYLMMIDYLELRFDSPGRSIGRYSLRKRLPLLKLPVLALTADKEGLRPQHDVVLALVKGARQHCFPGLHPLVVRGRVDEYVDVIDAFFQA